VADLHDARPGEPGGDSWSGLPLCTERVETLGFLAVTTRSGRSCIGETAQAKPWHASVRGVTDGDALYTNSTLAIDPKTGKVQW